MKTATQELILRTLALLGDMPTGQGWATATQISYWAGISKSVTYRYLKEMSSEGIIWMYMEGKKTRTVMKYKISNKGYERFEALQPIYPF